MQETLPIHRLHIKRSVLSRFTSGLQLQREPLERELAACAGQDAADMVLSLLVFKLEDRLSASAALQLPFFAAASLQPSSSVDAAGQSDVAASPSLDLCAAPEKKALEQYSGEAHRQVSLLADAQIQNVVQPVHTYQGQGLSQSQGFCEETGASGEASIQHSTQNDMPSDTSGACDDGGGGSRKEEAGRKKRNRLCSAPGTMLKKLVSGTRKLRQSCKSAVSLRRWCCGTRSKVVG